MVIVKAAASWELAGSIDWVSDDCPVDSLAPLSRMIDLGKWSWTSD